MLHSSLVELAEQAPHCQDTATARGVLAESLELARNAVNHDEDTLDIAQWYSAVITDVLASPGTEELRGGLTLVPTGAFGRGEALPTSTLGWLAVPLASATAHAQGADPASSSVAPAPARGFTELATHVGIHAEPKPLSPASAAEWADRLDSGAVSPELLADVAGWGIQAVIEHPQLHRPMLATALRKHPPALQVDLGLPRREGVVDIREDLVLPVVGVARWAGVTAGSEATGTLARLRAAAKEGVLTNAEADHLGLAWRSGLGLRLTRWVQRLSTHPSELANMPQLQRTTYGAACRMVAEVERSLSERYGVEKA